MRKDCSALINGQVVVASRDGQQATPLEMPVTAYLKENQVFCAAIKDSILAFGTVRGGAVVYELDT